MTIEREYVGSNFAAVLEKEKKKKEKRKERQR